MKIPSHPILFAAVNLLAQEKALSVAAEAEANSRSGAAISVRASTTMTIPPPHQTHPPDERFPME